MQTWKTQQILAPLLPQQNGLAPLQAGMTTAFTPAQSGASPGPGLNQGGIAASVLQRDDLLSYIRKIENTLLAQGAAHVHSAFMQSALIYWSSKDVSYMLPERSALQSLAGATMACAAFSEHRQEQSADGKPAQTDEFCFVLLGKELSVIVYGFCLEPAGAKSIYQCFLSFNAQMIMGACKSMAPYWEFIDPLEADKLTETIARLGKVQCLPHYVNTLGQLWSDFGTKSAGSQGHAYEASGPDPAASTGGAKANAAGRLVSSGIGSGIAAQSAAQTAAQTAEELWMKICHTYPYPVASPYRLLDCVTNPAEKYKEQLKLIENLLALLAGISLSISAQNAPRALADLKDCIAMGVSMGHWRELIRKCTVAWKNSSIKDVPLAKDILGLKIEHIDKSPFGKSVEQLIRARNDFAHHRGPTAESEIEKENGRLAGLLNECISQTAFLCNYQIRIVRSIDVLPSGVIKMICLKAVGDHPALRQEELLLNRGFPKGHLILDAGNSNWISLYPFITQDICSSCGIMEIYHLDKWRFDKNLIQVRSFERGHALESSTISSELKIIVGTVTGKP